MADDSLAEALEEFRLQFVRNSVERLQQMETAVDRSSFPTGSSDALRELSRHFHGLAGAGGTYGFGRVSEEASAGEAECEAVIADSRPPGGGEVARWRERIAAIRTELGSGGTGSAWMPVSARPAPSSDVLVVEDDTEVARILGRLCELEGFRHRRATSLAEARRLIDASFPDAILLDVGLPDGRGFEMVEEIRNLPGGESVVILVLSGLGGFEDRVEAIHCGADGYFVKPVDAHALLQRLRYLLDRDRAKSRRILSVEDEPDQAALIRAVLESAGYEVRVCAGARDFPGDLESFRPDLVLMDARLPDASGYELARYVRQDERFAALPIIFLTAEGLTSHRIEALRAGGDDHLAKPIAPGLLLSTVGARLERARFLGTLLLRDGLTGLSTHTPFLESVRIEASRLAQNASSRCSLVLVDLDRFRKINETHGYLAGDRALAALATLFRRRFRQSPSIGRLGGGAFGILLQDLRPDEASGLVERVRAEFAALSHAGAEGIRFGATISAGVAAFEPASMDFRSWMAAASSALADAKASGRNRVVSETSGTASARGVGERGGG